MSVPITPGTGASSVAAELVGGFNYQQIEVYGGGGASVLSVNPDGSFKASIIGVPTVSFSGSPSISGAVTIVGTPSISGAVTVVGTPSISGAVTVVGTPSISGSVNVPNTVSVTGAVQIAGSSPASIATVQRLDIQITGSTLGLVTQGAIHGLTTAGGGGYVEVKVDPSGALVTTASSVVAFQGGTRISSVISSTPSSMLTGASIFGQLPAGTAVLGSVATLQGTNPWIITGSVQGFPTTQNVSGSVAAFLTGNSSVITVNQGSVAAALIGNSSVITVVQGSVATATTITSIATANGGLPIWSPLGNRVQGTADFRGNAGASIAVLASGGAGVRNYVDHVQIMNFGSSSVLLTIADNTTSVLGYTIAPAGGGSNYDAMYRGAANSPITASVNGVASVLVSMQGFTSSA